MACWALSAILLACPLLVLADEAADHLQQTLRRGPQARRRDGIGCNNYFTPIHLQPFYRDLGYKPGDFPVCEKVSARTIALPFYNRLAEKDQDLVVECLKSALARL